MGTFTINKPLRTPDQNLVSKQKDKGQESVKTGRSAPQNAFIVYATAATHEPLKEIFENREQ